MMKAQIFEVSDQSASAFAIAAEVRSGLDDAILEIFRDLVNRAVQATLAGRRIARPYRRGPGLITGSSKLSGVGIPAPFPC